MRVAKDTQSYLLQKLEGAKILSPGSAYGISAISSVTGDFAVLQLERETYSFYEYKVENDRFRIENYAEQCSHQLFANIPNEVLVVPSAQKWHDCVFWTHNGISSYDNLYNNLRVAEGCDLLFEEAIATLSSILHSMQIPICPKTIFLIGSYAHDAMLRYVLQEEFSKDMLVKVLPMEPKDMSDIDSENKYILLDEQRLERTTLNISGGLTVRFISDAHVTIHLPLCMVKNDVIEGQHWESLLSNRKPDYRVGELDYKYLTLHAECDTMGYIYIIGKDMYDNTKVIQI